MKFPSIRDVAGILRDTHADLVAATDSGDELGEDGQVDVRLQVYPDGAWQVHTGDASYDTDHRGFWGSTSIPTTRERWSSYDVARDLIEQCRDDHAQSADAEVK
jgi:hypothetical protein